MFLLNLVCIYTPQNGQPDVRLPQIQALDGYIDLTINEQRVTFCTLSY